MDRLRCDESSEWLAWSDWLVVMTVLMLLLLGLIRSAQADDATGVVPAMAFSDVEDLGVECPPQVCGPACCDPICHVLDPWGVDPVWSGRTEALLLWRDAPQSVPIYSLRDAGTGLAAGSALNASNLASGMAAGPRFTLFRHTGDNGEIEFNYFRVQSFTATKKLPTNGAGYLQDDAFFCCPSTTPYSSVTGSLSSAFQSFELNRRFPTDGGFQWLTGFRWVEWNDTFGLSSVLPVPGVAPETYATSTFNDLYGWQFGADSILLGLGSPWRLEGLAKAGVYYNQAGQASSAFYPLDGTALAVRTSKPATAFVGEIGLTGVYDIADWLSVRAGYAAFWLDGLALATNQVKQCSICNSPFADPQGPTHVGGGVFVQGITLGLEGRW